ncbi:MAG: SBBP repeat-containing protein [Bacteroidia bacterium]
MKKTTLSILLAIIATVLNAQNPAFKWADALAGNFNLHNTGIAVDANKNVYLSGYFNDSVDFNPGPGTFKLFCNGVYDICIYSLDSSGHFRWAKQMGAYNDDRANSIALDASGNVYFTGYFQGSVDFDPGAGQYNINSMFGIPNIYVGKLDNAGNFVWAKAFLGSGNGSGDFASGKSIALDGSGNVYTTGFFQGTFDFDPDNFGTYSVTSAGDKEAYISKLNSSGAFMWAKKIGSTGYDVNYAIVSDAGGNIYTKGLYSGTVDLDPGAGVYNLSFGFPDQWAVTKLNTAGDFVYAKILPAYNIQDPKSIAVDASGNLFNVGSLIAATDFDPGPGVFNLDPNNTTYTDIYISKLDPAGIFLWAKKYGSINDGDYPTAVTIDGANNLFMTGFGYTGSGTVTSGIFISKLNNDGNEYWTQVFTSAVAGQCIGYAIAVDDASNVYTTGDFKMTVDFNPGAGVFNLTAPGPGYVAAEFIQKMNYGCTTPSGNITYLTNDSICAGDTAILQANASPGVTYQWFKGINAIAGANAQQLKVTAAATYKVIVSSGPTCNKTFAGKAIKIVSLPVSTIAAAGPITFCAGQSVMLNANVSPNLTYKWKKGTTDIAGATSPSYTASQAGTYKCTTTNSFGCSKASNGIKITINCREELFTESDKPLLYPNPATESTTLQFIAGSENATVTIIDIAGKQIQTINLATTKDAINSIEIPVKNFAAGLYFMKLQNSDSEKVLRFAVNR